MLNLNSILKFQQEVSFGSLFIKAGTELPVTDITVSSIDREGKATNARVVLGHMLEVSLEEVLKVLAYDGIKVLERDVLYPHKSMRIRDHLVDMLKVHPNCMDDIALYSVWHDDDIRESRQDLTDEEVAAVCSAIISNHNAEVGVNWDVIKTTIDEMFPQ